jgi:arrestin-related trafficking adapter 4/5/7
MPLDEEGNIVDQSHGTPLSGADAGTVAPPGYGEHILDQLYEDVDMSGFQTPGIQSGMNSPYYAQSRAGSSENLTVLPGIDGVAPALLSSRLQNVSLDAGNRNSSYSSLSSYTPGFISPTSNTQSISTALTRSNSEEDTSGRNSPEHLDFPELSELNKVPSYATAVKTPARSRTFSGGVMLPDYVAATSAPASPSATETAGSDYMLSPIQEVVTNDTVLPPAGSPPRSQQQQSHVRSNSHTRSLSMTSMLIHRVHSGSDPDERRRLHLIQARDRII